MNSEYGRLSSEKLKARARQSMQKPHSHRTVYRHYFSAVRCQVYRCRDGVDTLYGDNDIAPFKNVLNEMYARDISKKQRASMANRRANGLFTGNLPPYGYLIDPEKKHRFIVDETAAKVVRHIFDLALQGYGGRAIGTMLQHEKVLRPSYHYAEIGLKCERFRQKNISGMSRPSAKR